MQKVFPFFVAHARPLFEGIEVSKLPVLAENKDDQVIEALGLLGPLPLNYPGTCPRSFGDVVGVFFLPGATEADECGINVAQIG